MPGGVGWVERATIRGAVHRPDRNAIATASRTHLLPPEPPEQRTARDDQHRDDGPGDRARVDRASGRRGDLVADDGGALRACPGGCQRCGAVRCGTSHSGVCVGGSSTVKPHLCSIDLLLLLLAHHVCRKHLGHDDWPLLISIPPLLDIADDLSKTPIRPTCAAALCQSPRLSSTHPCPRLNRRLARQPNHSPRSQHTRLVRCAIARRGGPIARYAVIPREEGVVVVPP
jgi:hypothetical protein